MNPLFMSWWLLILYLVIISMINKGLPPSISDGFYVLKEAKKELSFLFFFFMIAIGATFMIYGFTHFGDWPFAWLIFLSSGGLMFVGAASEFKESFVKRVHVVSAIICALSITIWTIIYGNIWMVVLFAGVFLIINQFDRKAKRHILWMELFAFVNAFYQLDHVASISFNL